MRNIVVLGAGTGGAIVANMISAEINLNEWKVTVIDKADEHHYQPGYLFIPFKLYGYDTREDIVRPIGEALSKNVELVKAEARRIDHENKKVETDCGNFDYDWLVCALGCHIAPDEVEGLEDALGNGDAAYSFYTLDHALEMQQPMEDMQSGKLVINTADMPIKCPVAPLEFAFLADYYFTRKGVRDQIEIDLVTPYSGAFTKPNANRILSKVAEEKRINVVPNFALERVDGTNHKIHSFEGDSLDYDLLCVVPPNLGPELIDASGLGDGTGYGLTDPKTLRSRKADHIYFIGDNSNVATSKAGSVAHFQAETVVENILREIESKKPLPSFDGHANCYIETGYDKAMLIDFNYDMEPLEGKFPMPVVGPFSLLKETNMNHIGKLAFKWVYWNMLLPGYLPYVPMLPSQMDFVGKKLATTPHLRHANALKVGEIMTRDVVTVSTGTSLTNTAKLFTKHNVSGLPVVDHNEKLVGVVTEHDFLEAIDDALEDSPTRDLLELVIKGKRASKKSGTTVESLMTPNPVCVKESDSLQRAIELMGKNKIKRLVVTDMEGHVQGVVSRPDLLTLFLRKD